MANVRKQSSMSEISTVQKQISTIIGGWFNWIRWNGHIDDVKSQGDMANASTRETQKSQEVCSLTDKDELLSNEIVKIHSGL
jgi:chitinase